MRRWANFILIGAAKLLSMLAILAAVARPATAQPTPSVPPPAPPVEVSAPAERIETPIDALTADAQTYAKAFNLPIAEALRRLEAQEASVGIVDRLAQTYRSTLTGIIIEHRPEYRIVIVVTGPPADDVLIGTAPFGVPILRRSGAQASRAQTVAAIEQHQGEIAAMLTHAPGLGVDPRTGALIVLTRAGDDDGEKNKDATAARIAAIAGVPVIVTSWGDYDTNLSVEGGGRVVGLDATGTRRGLCTSGFVVTDGVQTALSTAAHCPDTLSFVDGDGKRTPLAMIGAWGAKNQDVQLHTAGLPLQPLFHGDDEGSARVAATWRNRASTRAGDFVCHRGQRTDYSCALVQMIDFAPPGELCAGPCPATWVMVGGPTCKSGDSGGPVFLGSVAFGLMKGATTLNGVCKVYYYMSVDYLPPGWTVLHGRMTAPPVATATASPTP